MYSVKLKCINVMHATVRILPVNINSHLVLVCEYYSNNVSLWILNALPTKTLRFFKVLTCSEINNSINSGMFG